VKAIHYFDISNAARPSLTRSTMGRFFFATAAVFYHFFHGRRNELIPCPLFVKIFFFKLSTPAKEK